MEMAGEFLDDPDVGFYGTLSIITSLEFLQHHSAKMGHKDTSCDHNLSPCQATIARFTSREASAAPAAWFKRASVDKKVSETCDPGRGILRSQSFPLRLPLPIPIANPYLCAVQLVTDDGNNPVVLGRGLVRLAGGSSATPLNGSRRPRPYAALSQGALRGPSPQPVAFGTALRAA